MQTVGMAIPELFPISCKNDVLGYPTNFDGDMWRGASIGIEMKSKIEAHDLIQGEVEWMIAAHKSLVPFLQVHAVSSDLYCARCQF